jgi:ankyrin repeat domain-containing protein 50
MVIDCIQARIERTQSQEGSAFFYCSYLEHDRRNALSVLRSYVRQLAAPRQLGNQIHFQLKTMYDESKRNGADWTIKQCEEYLITLLNFYPHTTLILDALDECDIEQRIDLLNFFQSLEMRVQKPVKIFIASRPEGDIRERLITMRNIEINETNNTEDIKRFITDSLEARAPWTALLNRNEALKQRVVQAFLDKSQGMFLYVKLQIGDLRVLNKAADVDYKLATLPNGLNETYQRIYDRILNGGKSSAAAASRALK